MHNHHDLLLADVVPGNGGQELIIVGGNNEYRTGIVAVLDPFKMYGASPQSKDYYTNQDVPPGNAIYYLKYPLTHFTELFPTKRDRVEKVFWKDGSLMTLLRAPYLQKGYTSHVIYYLNQAMEVTFVDLSDLYYYLYKMAFPEQDSLPINDPEILQYFRQVQYWDGITWRDSSTRNRRYIVP